MARPDFKADRRESNALVSATIDASGGQCGNVMDAVMAKTLRFFKRGAAQSD
jgi:hypothetical protein